MAVAVQSATAGRRIPRVSVGTILLYGVLIFGAVVMLYPFVYMLSTSLKSAAQVYISPSSLPGTCTYGR